MHAFQLLSTAILGAVATSAAAVPCTPVARQEASTLPTFCTALDPPPTAEELEARHIAFSTAFIVTKNLTEAYSYVSGTTYINHNPQAEDGAEFSYNGLAQLWPIATVTEQRFTFEDPQTWLGYTAFIPGVGPNGSDVTSAIVDRFRWEAGCIVEHWDAGEVYPGDAAKLRRA